MGLNLDMTRAWDRLEWPFIKNTLNTIGFPNNLTRTFMNCVTTIYFSILINNHNSDWFYPTRGIIQWDILSHYLFILYAEILSGLLIKSQNKGNIHRLAIAKNSPPISHLFFVDDSLVFCRIEEEEVKELKDIFLSLPKFFVTNDQHGQNYHDFQQECER